MARRSTKAREIQRRDVSRQNAREIQKAREIPARGRRSKERAGNAESEGIPGRRRRATESAENPATWRIPIKSAGIQRSDVHRRRGSPRERRRSREIEER